MFVALLPRSLLNVPIFVKGPVHANLSGPPAPRAEWQRAPLGQDALVGRILRSPIAHANILSIDTSKAEALAGDHAKDGMSRIADYILSTMAVSIDLSSI